MRTAVVTDSAANLPPEMAAEHGISVVPMYLKFGESVYQDGVDLPRDEFYAKLEREEVPVSTAAPSVGDYREAFERALEHAEGVVCVTVASFVSVSFDSARGAANELGGRVKVVDSKSASMGEGWAALEAARLAAEDAGLDEVVARTEEVAARTQLAATINTFEFLRRSGRVHALLAYAGTALNIKPVFALRGGKIEQLGRPRSRARAIERILDETRPLAAHGPLRCAVAHAAVPEEADALLARITAELDCVETLLTEFTPLMGAHTGPGVLAIAAWS
ncbi:MAG: DegV family protein [Actinomycetota bacterium]